MSDENFAETSQIPKVRNQDVRFCFTCGREIPPGALFCPSCGRRLYAEPRDEARVADTTHFRLAILILAVAFGLGLPLGVVARNYVSERQIRSMAATHAVRSLSQEQTVETFYQQLNARNFNAAYAMLSPTLHRTTSFSTWSAGFDTTVSQYATVAPDGTNTYRVHLTALDKTPAGAIATTFIGDWRLVRDARHNRWLLDDPNFQKATSTYFDPRTAKSAPVSETYAKLKQSLALIATEDSGGVKFGTGFCIASNASTSYFLTNHHVIGDEGKVWVVLASGTKRPLEGRVVKVADSVDAAIVSIDVGALPVAMLARKNPPEGRRIGIAGYPSVQLRLAEADQGLSPSLHEGTVNALVSGQTIEFDAQTDHGNSGGPLFDAATGEVYGMVTWTLQSNQSLAVQNNFAISVESLDPFIRSAAITPW